MSSRFFYTHLEALELSLDIAAGHWVSLESGGYYTNMTRKSIPNRSRVTIPLGEWLAKWVSPIDGISHLLELIQQANQLLSGMIPQVPTSVLSWHLWFLSGFI